LLFTQNLCDICTDLSNEYFKNNINKQFIIIKICNLLVISNKNKNLRNLQHYETLGYLYPAVCLWRTVAHRSGNVLP
jgi:hypothetical protein